MTAITLAQWLPIKALMECEALFLRDATPILTTGKRKGKHALHLADASTQALTTSLAIWSVYQQAIGAGLPSEFQRPKQRPATPTPVERVWWEIERLARTLVASSRDPVTLKSAVINIVTADPSLRDRYAEAVERVRRRKARSRRR